MSWPHLAGFLTHLLVQVKVLTAISPRSVVDANKAREKLPPHDHTAENAAKNAGAEVGETVCPPIAWFLLPLHLSI